MRIGGLEVARIRLGAKGISHGYPDSGTDETEPIATPHRALELGVTLTAQQLNRLSAAGDTRLAMLER